MTSQTMPSKTSTVLKVTHNNGKMIAELSLPYVFTAFPITIKGLEQLQEDVQKALEAEYAEEKQLAAD